MVLKMPSHVMGLRSRWRKNILIFYYTICIRFVRLVVVLTGTCLQNYYSFHHYMDLSLRSASEEILTIKYSERQIQLWKNLKNSPIHHRLWGNNAKSFWGTRSSERHLSDIYNSVVWRYCNYSYPYLSKIVEILLIRLLSRHHAMKSYWRN